MFKLGKIKVNQVAMGERNENGGIIYVYYRR